MVIQQAGARQIANLTEETMSAPVANTVSWFEIGAPDVYAARAFYGPLFGWSFAPDGAYTLITAPGAEAPVRRHLQPPEFPRTRCSSSQCRM